MENFTNEQLPFAEKRPQFLQVLCILSFIGCGIMLLIGLFGLKNLFMSPEEILNDPNIQMMKQMSQESFDAVAEGLKYKDLHAIAGILVPLLSLAGVLMMWKLKKSGFFIYLIAELAPYVIGAVTGGTKSLSAMGGMMQNFESVIYVVIALVLIFDLAFFIMYAVNLKYMK